MNPILVKRTRYLPIHERIFAKPDARPQDAETDLIREVQLTRRPPTTGVVVSACASAIEAGIKPGVRIMWSESAHQELVERGKPIDIVALRYPLETLAIIEEYMDNETEEEIAKRVAQEEAAFAHRQSIRENVQRLRSQMDKCPMLTFPNSEDAKKDVYCPLAAGHEGDHSV